MNAHKLTPSIFHETKALIKLGLPLGIAMLGNLLIGLIDTAVVGHYSNHAIAGVSLGNSIFFGILILAMGTLEGLDPLINHRIGNGQKNEAGFFFLQGLWFSLFFGLIVSIVMISALAVLSLTSIDAHIQFEATQYVLARMPSIIPFLLIMTIRSFVQAHHITKPVLIAMIASNILNLPLSIVLVFGDSILIKHGLPSIGLPALSAAGAGWASSIAVIVQFFIFVFWLRHDSKLIFDYSVWKPKWNYLKQIIQMGIGIGTQRFFEWGLFSISSIITAYLGTTTIAAHQIAIMLSAIPFMIGMGLSMALSIRVGQAIGQKHMAKARLIGFIGIALSAIISIGCGLIIVLFSQTLMRIFTTSPDVMAILYSLLIIIALFQIADIVQTVCYGALKGLADTRWPMVQHLISIYAIGIPAALILAFYFDLEIYGIWIGKSIGLSAVMILFIYRFHVKTMPISDK